jgi:hypothetical protein
LAPEFGFALKVTCVLLPFTRPLLLVVAVVGTRFCLKLLCLLWWIAPESGEDAEEEEEEQGAELFT